MMAESNFIVDIRASVRLRPAMYFGCTTSRGVVHVVNELVSNGIDLGATAFATCDFWSLNT
jgi:DNA gyrase/topoisomerase IV subunit B